jgi:hypothetical protein
MSTYVPGETMPIKALLLMRTLGVIGVAALTTVPPSSIVGAMLWAGYLGNVVVTHFN